jgi:hypothetical protein
MGITKEKLNKVVENINLNDSINKVTNFDKNSIAHLETVPARKKTRFY